MQCAQLMLKHTAQLAGMQAAYALGVEQKPRKVRRPPKDPSLRRLVRKARLKEAIGLAGGVTELADLIGTPKSHISAMQHGARGVGDDLAARIEKALDRPPGWMDLQPQIIGSEQARFAADLEDIRRLNPQTYSSMMIRIAKIAEGFRETDRMLREKEGVNGYVTPERAAETLGQPKKDDPSLDADHDLGGISGLGDLDDDPAPAPAPASAPAIRTKKAKRKS